MDPQPVSYIKEATAIAKFYSDSDKYDGVSDSFDFKLNIFHDICNRVGLPPDGYSVVFPTMLKGLAQEHYYTSNLASRPFSDACDRIRQFFEGPEYHRKNLTIWNNTTLQGIINENSDKSIYQCFQLLTDKLLKIRHGIHPEFRTTLFLINKLITACQGVPACRIAISDPPEELSGLISKLQSSIVAWEKEKENTIGSQALVRPNSYNTTSSQDQEAYYTDRKYHRNDRNDRYGRKYDRKYDRKPTYRTQNRSGKCYVCQKESCRSWKHTEQERKDAKLAYRQRFQNNKGTGNFDDRYRQYMQECEGDDDEGVEAFEALVLDKSNNLIEDSDSDCYTTSLGPLSITEATNTSSFLANRSLAHLLLNPIEAKQDGPFTYIATTKPRYSSESFAGIMIDTGASRKSTGGYGQFLALQRSNKTVTLDITTKGQVNIQFGIGNATSIGTAEVTCPIGKVQFHIVHADTPFLLCLADMDSLQIYYNNLKNVVITRVGDVPVVRRYGHPFLLWDSSLQSYLCDSFCENPCYLTDIELRQLHRRFGHPSVDKLQKLLFKAGHTDIERTALEQLAKYCHHCQKHSKGPGRFRFTLRDDEINFNYNIIVDIMYISGAPLLHIVDEATRFCAGRWLQDISAKHTWDILRTCWIDTYLGPPDLITHDAGKNFISKEFKHYASELGTRTKAVPVESHNSIGMVERYHGPIRRAYQIIVTELPGIDKHMALQMAFKAINDTAGPEGLVPTLLVFGAYPRMVESDPPSPTVTQRASALKKAMVEIQKLRAERQVTDALRMRNGPNTTAIHDLPTNSPVLVWREGSTGYPGQWEGPYNLLTIEGETCTLEMPRGPTPFRSTSVKPYYKGDDGDEDLLKDPRRTQQDLMPDAITPEAIVPSPIGVPTQGQSTQQVQKRGRGRPRKYPLLTATTTVYLQSDNNTTRFSASRQKEVNGLLEKGVFKVIHLLDVPQGVRLFNSRFVDTIKNEGTEKAFEKSRLVVQAYNDAEKDLILTQSPTIQRVSQRLILCIAAIKQNTKLYLRDISQAYVQSTTSLNREFYVRPPKEIIDQLGIDRTAILKVVKPLYGVPEAGNHWFRTYHSHHIDHLHTKQSTYDPCLLYTNDPFGVVGLQIDDTLFVASTEFARAEQDELYKAHFMAKDRDELAIDKPLQFNGGLIQLRADGSITLTQEKQCKKIGLVTTVKGNAKLKDEYIAQRARGAYIASMCQPEASFDLSFAAQAIHPTNENTKDLNKRLGWQLDNSTRGLTFVRLDENSLQLLVFTDASFANNKDLSSQIGYVVVLADNTNSANILHWSSLKCKRVTRSVLASELYAMVQGFDIGASIKTTIEKALGIDLPLIVCTDSKSLYDCLVRLGTTAEKRLMIDVMCLRQAYERREIAEVKWINGDSNPADAMTKAKACDALQRLIDTNRIDLKAIGWVERTEDTKDIDGDVDTKE
jgi:hypothetical protein